MSLLTPLAASLLAVTAAAPNTSSKPSHPVIELRQYKLTPHSQAAFIQLFDREFVDTQEAVGMRLVGQFHDHDRPDRFTWVREFPNMDARAKMLDAFYNGPVWQRFRGIANPMLFDNDNVLLLRPSRPNSGFGPSAARPTGKTKTGKSDTIFAVIEYLWREPGEGFDNFFLDEMAPMISKAGLPILGAYVPEEEPNNFPRLPTRPDKRIFVWFTKAGAPDDFQRIMSSLKRTPAWHEKIQTELGEAQEREPQVLRLDPTPRSALR